MATTAETEIRTVIDSWAKALRAKDAKGVVAHLSPDFLHYSLAPPLRSSGNGTDGLQSWFDTWDAGLGYDIRDLKITAAGDIAFSHSLNHLSGTKRNEGKSEVWFRQTLGFRRIAGTWKIVHEHESVPFYMDGSLKAAVDLKP
ncbi:hypothetical protein BH10PSE7_BH10PSE7_14370 [soil metagenome]